MELLATHQHLGLAAVVLLQPAAQLGQIPLGLRLSLLQASVLLLSLGELSAHLSLLLLRLRQLLLPNTGNSVKTDGHAAGRSQLYRAASPKQKAALWEM